MSWISSKVKFFLQKNEEIPREKKLLHQQNINLGLIIRVDKGCYKVQNLNEKNGSFTMPSYSKKLLIIRPIVCFLKRSIFWTRNEYETLREKMKKKNTISVVLIIQSIFIYL